MRFYLEYILCLIYVRFFLFLTNCKYYSHVSLDEIKFIILLFFSTQPVTQPKSIAFFVEFPKHSFDSVYLKELHSLHLIDSAIYQFIYI